MEIHWLTQLFVSQMMILRDDDYTIILMEVAKVKEEIREVNKALHKLGRKFGVCMFPIPEVAPPRPVSNMTPPESVPAVPKDAA